MHRTVPIWKRHRTIVSDLEFMLDFRYVAPSQNQDDSKVNRAGENWGHISDFSTACKIRGGKNETSEFTFQVRLQPKFRHLIYIFDKSRSAVGVFRSPLYNIPLLVLLRRHSRQPKIMMMTMTTTKMIFFVRWVGGWVRQLAMFQRLRRHSTLQVCDMYNWLFCSRPHAGPLAVCRFFLF